MNCPDQDKCDIVRKLEKENAELRALVDKLKKRIEEFESKSSNQSNKKLDIKLNTKTRRKKRGRKKGHKGSTRPLPDKYDEEIEATLDSCPNCGEELGESFETRERYVEDIQPVRAVKVTKVNQHRYKCGNCGKKVTAKSDIVLPGFRFGINFLVFVVYQYYILGVTYNKIITELKIWFGLKVSEGTINNTIQTATKIFGSKFEELKEALRKESYVNDDETGWRVKGKNYWLWAFVSEKITLYIIDKSRGSKVPKKILGKKFKGVVGSDFYSSYNPLKYKKQKCWLHVLKKTSEHSKKNQECKLLHKRLKRLYHDAVKFDSEKHTQEEIQDAKQRFERRLDTVVNQVWNDPDNKTIIKRLRKHRNEMFTFLEVEGLKADNNAAERAIRPNVIKRKISSGNRSESGANAHQVLMSIIKTYEKQDLNPINEMQDYIRQVPSAK